MDLIVNKVKLEDIADIQSISKHTFIETFADHNTSSDMQIYLDDSFSYQKITNELSDPNSEFYFALLNNRVVGYLKLNYLQAQTELKENKSIEIERIYVLKEFHGKKVGQALYNKALDIAYKRDSEYVWLGVWEKNLRAINFYKKNGFVAFDKHIFKLGNDEQVDIMMRLNLSSQ